MTLMPDLQNSTTHDELRIAIRNIRRIKKKHNMAKKNVNRDEMSMRRNTGESLLLKLKFKIKKWYVQHSIFHR